MPWRVMPRPYPVCTRSHSLNNWWFYRCPLLALVWAEGSPKWLAVVVQLLSCVWLFVTPWPAAHQTSLSSTISQSLLKLMSIESMMPTSHLILCHPVLLLPPIFPTIRVFSSELALHIKWPKYWSFIFSSVGVKVAWGCIKLGFCFHISAPPEWPLFN